MSKETRTIFESVGQRANEQRNTYRHIVRSNDIVYKMYVMYDSAYMFQSSCSVSMFVHGHGFVTLVSMSGDEMPKLEKGVSIVDYMRAQALMLFETAVTIVKG
jgi:hypothetical protein